MRAMILAAGRGERMRELTAVLPKPLLEVGGSTLIERHVEALKQAGITELVVNLAYGGEQIRRKLGDGTRWGTRIEYSDEGPEALETGGGIIRALPLLGPEPFLCVNADVVTDFDYTELRHPRGEGMLVLVANPQHNPAGDFGLGADARLSSSPPRLTYSGIALLEPRLFRGWRPGRQKLRPIFDAAIGRGALYGVRHEGLWVDVGTPQRLSAARRALAAPSDS